MDPVTTTPPISPAGTTNALSDRFGAVGRNFSLTTSRSAFIGYSKAALGGIIFPLIPTAIESAFKVDMTGFKGWLTGGLIAIGAGMAAGWDDAVAGTVGAMSAQLLYARGQIAVKSVMGKMLYRFDPTNLQTMSDGVPLSPTQALQPGAQLMRQPDGSTVVLHSAASVNAAPTMRDYVDPTAQQLNDYVAPTAQQLNDYVPPAQSSLADSGSQRFDENWLDRDLD